MSEPPRRDPRITLGKGLLVRCDSWSEFVALYAADISQGGMFIVTEEPPALFSEIEVQVSLPEGHDVVMRASVVHVIEREQAEREGRKPGIGVQFLGLDSVIKAQIHQLVEFARWEGASGALSVSLATRMFETSLSLPPEKAPTAPPEAPAQGASSGRPSAASAQPSAAPSKTATKPAPRPTPPPSAAEDSEAEQAASVAEEGVPAAEPGAEPASGTPLTQKTGKPLDIDKLRLGMTDLAHRRITEAIKIFEELVAESPQDPQPQIWLSTARARLRLKNKDETGAAVHYRQVLVLDESNHEARKYVRDHGTKKRLEALPFGRYFVKK